MPPARLRHDLHEANRASWNAATLAHQRHQRDEAAFLRGGGTTLFPEERALLGDVRGLRLLHLQCNAGQDTLSLAQLGAPVVGVDISDTAIHAATELARATGLAATFARADVYDWLASAEPASFDVVFCSYGSLCWLSDLPTWARGVTRVLRPGGRFVCVEFHPLVTVLDENLQLRHDTFFADAPLQTASGVGDYVADSATALTPSGRTPDAPAPFVNPHPSYEFACGLGAVVTALANAGLTLAHLQEYPFTNGWKPFPAMIAQPGSRWTLPPGTPALPLMYSLVATQR